MVYRKPTGEFSSPVIHRRYMDFSSILSPVARILGITFIILFIAAQEIYGQTNTWDGPSGGNWNTAANWSLNQVPTSAHDVIIPNKKNVTINTAAVCASFTINSGNRANEITISGSNSLTVTNDIVIDNPTSNNRSKIIDVGSGSLSCGSITVTATGDSRRTSGITLSTGTVTVNGDFTMGDENNLMTFTGSGILYIQGNMTGGTLTASTGTVNYNGAGAQIANGYTYYNLTLSGSGVKTTNSIMVDGTLAMEGTATAGGTTPSFGAASSIEYKGSSAQTTGIEFPDTFNGSGGIIINNASGVSLQSSKTLESNLILTNGTFSVGSNTLTLNGPSIAGTPSNLATTSSSDLVFGGSSSGINIPSSIANLRNLTINNVNGVVMNSNITLASNGVLSLTSGILEAGQYILSINNSNSSSIAYSEGSFINVTTGSLQRSIASNLTGTGNNYLFPIGESNTYKAINLIDVNTGATGPVLRASVSPTGATTGDNTTIGPVDPRYWSLINTNNGNFTSSSVELFENGIDPTKTIGMSSAVSGIYNSIGGVSGASSIVSSVIPDPGPYFCIGTLVITTLYSYQSGLWSSSSTWTTDPSGTLQIGSSIPENGTIIVILSDRTVTLASDIPENELDITINQGGYLDLLTYRFSNPLSALRGQGIMKLASANFPSASLNTFIDAGGGTVEYNNTSNFNLPVSQTTYNNLTINTPGFIATQLHNLSLNGNLYVKGGTLRINDNSATAKLNLTISGNVTVDNGALITVGNGITNPAIGGTGGTAPFLNYYTNFHTVIVRGDFTNNGTVRFTNLNYPVFNAFPPTVAGPTCGAATVYFQGANDNSLTCNGVTAFYNLIINKGTDQTYKLNVISSDYGNFRLYGANVLPVDGAISANPSLRKALWIYTGTLVLKGRLIIPSLSEGVAANAEYYIPSNGSLQIDGVDVVVLSTADDFREINTAYGVTAPDNATIGAGTGGVSALDIFGKLQINNGFLSTRESGGLITSSVASGQLIINGGTIDAKQFLSSSGSASYTQTGGTLILRGRFQRTPSSYSGVSDLTNVSVSTLNTSRIINGINPDYGTFNLENTANIYSISGGTIRIYDVCGIAAGQQEAFDVKSASSNINVTGGTLEVIPVTGSTLADASNYYINTTASLYNLVVNRLSSASAVGLSAALTVQNHLNLLSGNLSANNYDLSVGGNVTIENGTAYTPGTNTTVLNGPGNQTFTINLASALSLYNLTITKSAGTSVTLAGSQNTLNVTNGLNLSTGTFNDGGKTINISGNVFNSGVHSGSGAIVLNGSNTQIINGSGVFQNLTLNNTNGAAAPVSLAANMTLNGALTFSQNKLFNISTYNLILNSSASFVNISSSRYVQTAGNAGDGGITRFYASSSTLNFPVGVANYTPASLGLSTAPTAYGSITVIPVNYAHPNATTTGRSLTYFWRVKSSGFTLGTAGVTHGYYYDQGNVVTGANITENGYVAARFDRTTNQWSKGTVNDVDETNNIIGEPGTGSYLENIDFIDGDYTAGDDTPTSPFGIPTVYYSRQSGLWSNVNTWSLTGHTVNNPPAVVPGASDIVMIGDRDSVYLSTNNTIANTGSISCATLQIEAGSALDIGYNPSSVFSMVVSDPNGNGNFRVTTNYNSPSTFSFPSGDFTEFNVNTGTTELYTTNSVAGGTYYLPTTVSNYGTLILSPLGGSNVIFANRDIVIYGDLITRGQNADSWFLPSWGRTYPGSVTAVDKTIYIKGDMDIQGGALIWYENRTTAQNFVIDGNVNVATLSALYVYSGATNQTMSIGGSLINNTNGQSNGTTTTSKVDFTNIPVTFFGSTNESISNTAGTPLTVFSTLTINKGASQTNTLTCNIGGTLTTPDNNWLFLQNGTFIYARTDPASDFTISTNTSFTIPSTAGLTIDYSNANNKNIIIGNSSDNGDLMLSGKLTLITGNVYIGGTNSSAYNNDIEYSGSGASEIDIRGGNLIVNGQIRRPVGTTNGILRYSQTGGNLIIFGNNSEVTKAKFEILNSGSSFTMSGGTLSIVRGGGTTFGDLYLRPETYAVTGGTIYFTQSPVEGPAVDEAQSYSLDANIPLNNLIISGKTTGTNRLASLNLMISPLVLNGSLSLNNNQSIFNSNNLDLSIQGNLNNSGTYSFGTNKTTFNGVTQSITGTSVSNFNDLEISSATSLTVNGSFTVYGDLSLLSGNTGLTSSLITLIGNFTNNGAFSDDNFNGGVSLSGVSQQEISGTGSFGRIIINNASGVKLTSEISLQNDLVLTAGVFDINKFQLTLNQNSSINGAPFSSAKMIKSDGVSSSMGVVKFFPATPQTFTFPVGTSGKYTPAILTISANGSVGSIRVNPVDECNQSVTDPGNTLGYFWHIESSGISGFNANLLLQYLIGDVAGNESDYVAARLLLPGSSWEKAPPGPLTDNVNEDLHQITFLYFGTNNLNGDYTAGTDAAIPDEVPTYQTNNDGLWTNEAIWTPVGSSPPCPPGGPVGSTVIIDHIVTINVNFTSALNTTINNELRIASTTYGHNLGYVSGDGKLHLENGVFPGGVFTDFLNCSGNSTIEYGGSGTYTLIVSQFSTLPNLSFSGTGTRVLPVTDLTVCKRLVIDGPVLDNSINNRMLTIKGTIERYNTGIFNSGTGSYPSATVVFEGSSAQSVGGPTGDFSGSNKFNNIEINNPAGISIGSGGLVEINNQLVFTNGIIGTSSTNRLVLLSTSLTSVSPEGGTSASFVDGPLTKYLVNGDAFVFPLGYGVIKSHEFTLTSAAGTTLPWTVEYTRPNPTSTSLSDPLEVCNTLEYWSVSSTISTEAKVMIAWDPQSDLTPLMTMNGISDMRVAEYDTGFWTEVASVTSGDNYNGAVATLNNISVSATPKNFTSASVSGTLSRASFAASGYVCGNGGIPISFISFTPINLEYTLSYSIDNIPQTDVVVTSLPYTMPTPVAGVYRLTGFRFNNGSGTGVVDITPVTVYDLPPTSDAGPDLSLCGISTTILEGSDPLSYTGRWTISDGSGASFTNSAQYNTVFNGTLGTSYTLLWTISNGPCTSADEVVISFPVVASTPEAFTSAPSVACPGTTGYVYTVPFKGAVTYNWSYTGSGHTIHGTGNSVTIDFSSDATSGTLSVTATNNCGTSAPRTTAITVPSAAFSYPSTPYCQNEINPDPVLNPGSTAGTFSSAAGIVFVSELTGTIDLLSSISGNYTVTNSIDVAGCGTIISTSPVTISGLSWTGSSGTNWNSTGNWSCTHVPYPTTNVIIPNVANEPQLTGGSAGTVNNITIESGSSLTISDNTLQISGAIINNGTFDVSDGTIIMNGSSAQTIGSSVFSGNTVKNLSVNNSTGVNLLGPLNVTGIVSIQNGALASDGYLTLASSPSGTALIDGTGAGSVTGNVTMQRYLPSAYSYKYISSPFQNATVNELSDDINLADFFPPLFRYDESRTTSGWIDYITITDPLNPLEGYTAHFGSSALPLTADITGVVNNGPLSVTLYNHNNPYTLGYNLVGNPYPSPIDWDAISGWTKINIDDALYYFKASTTDEYGGTYSTYINGISSDGQASAIIPSMQGFFVHVTDDTYPVTGTLGLNNSVRVTDFTTPYMKSGEKDQPPLLRIDATFDDDPLSADPLTFYYDEKAGPAFNSHLDALKLLNTDYSVPNLYTFTAEGKKLSIHALPETDDTLRIIPLGLKTNIDGTIVFKLIDDELSTGDIFITDLGEGIQSSLIGTSGYKVFLKSGEYIDRFYLNLTKPQSEITEPPVEPDLFSVYSSYGMVKVRINTDKTGSGTFSLYSLTGQRLFVRKITDPDLKEFYPGLMDGIYIASFASSTHVFSEKIFIHDR